MPAFQANKFCCMSDEEYNAQASLSKDRAEQNRKSCTKCQDVCGFSGHLSKIPNERPKSVSGDGLKEKKKKRKVLLAQMVLVTESSQELSKESA